MTEERVGRTVRAIRQRRGWTQRELARRAGVSDTLISRVERGQAGNCSIHTLLGILRPLEAQLSFVLRWRGGEVDRLLDADHAELQERWARRLTGIGWVARQEVSYSQFGERGSIDDLAFHPATRTVLVSELKTGIFDAQGLLAKIDQKERLARDVARRFGWHVENVVAALVIAEGRTNRRRIEQLPMLFRRFDRRGRAALAWLRNPTPTCGGLLVYEKSADSRSMTVRRAGRQRVRHPRGSTSVEPRTSSWNRPPSRA